MDSDEQLIITGTEARDPDDLNAVGLCATFLNMGKIINPNAIFSRRITEEELDALLDRCAQRMVDGEILYYVRVYAIGEKRGTKWLSRDYIIKYLQLVNDAKFSICK